MVVVWIVGKISCVMTHWLFLFSLLVQNLSTVWECVAQVHDELQGSQCLHLLKTRGVEKSITANLGSLNGGGGHADGGMD